MAVMDYIYLSFKLARTPRLSRILLKPCFAALIMGAAAWAVYGLLSRALGPGRMSLLLALGAAIFIAVAIYLALTVLTRMITREDMAMIPGGEKLAKLLHMHE